MGASRREFLAAALAGGAAWLGGCQRPVRFPGSIVGASAADGHRLRAGGFPAPSETLEAEFAVVGGGVAGLAAARVFAKAGKDFVLLELEKETGGNAASGANGVSAYPWGAHYVPIPNAESVEVIALLSDLGLVTGHDANGLPIYDEYALCFDPMERLYLRGRWQEGFVPQLGITARDRAQYDAFFGQMESWRAARGSDGLRAFAIPLDLSSADQEWRALDLLTMKEFMDRRGWDSPPLRWYVDYCCRDDYGAGIDKVSAWAGAHYFSSRNGLVANAPRDSVLTWPEGNGWLVHRMAEPLRSRIRPRCIAWNIESVEGAVLVDFFDFASGRSVRLHAKGVVCAAPRFVAQHIVRGIEGAAVEYSPWMVANVTLDALPAERGASLAWDNVFYEGESLGYVVATHQQLDRVPRETVLTHYWPLDRQPPREARETALARSHESWCSQIVAELQSVHPGIETRITQLDVWLWGHGMVRPVPGFVWGETRRRMQNPLGRIRFAHSDMSGISIFEEAFTRGVQAARDLLENIA
jgi:NAD(P)-binding Rossmann-like domain